MHLTNHKVLYITANEILWDIIALEELTEQITSQKQMQHCFTISYNSKHIV